MMARSRKPEVYADAAYAVLSRPAREFTGNTLLCEDVLLDSGVSDLSVYDCVPGTELGVDFWVDSPNPPGTRNRSFGPGFPGHRFSGASFFRGIVFVVAPT